MYEFNNGIFYGNNGDTIMRMKLNYFTDIYMNTIINSDLPGGYRFKGSIKELFIEVFGNNQCQIVLKRELLGVNTTQGNYFGGDCRPIILGFNIKGDNLTVLFKAGQLGSAKKLYKKMFNDCITSRGK